MTNYSTIRPGLFKNPAGKKTTSLRHKANTDLRKKQRKTDRTLNIYEAGWIPGN